QDVEALWQAVAGGKIDTVVSDHACITKAIKGADMWAAPPGFGGTSLMLPLLLSEGYHKRGLSLTRIAELTALNPSICHGLYPKKGSIVIGGDADFAIVDLEKEQRVSTALLNSAQDYTPFEGALLKGWPVRTMLRGETVFEDGAITGRPGYGEYVKRPVALHYGEHS
ncbi:MAG: amidohydrolase family protein, partial [Dehalococcoidia bacterium]|nr:amidohydrolase family protein [Dehalococcoidia bacterium]